LLIVFSFNYCIKDLFHSQLRYCNDGYQDCHIVFEQRHWQVFSESPNQAHADSRTTQRAGNSKNDIDFPLVATVS
jgi:hypothetical protein